MSTRGYNPMRWDCEKNGCFNQKKRPKIELFADCFPGSISFGDVDAEVELNGYGLRMEWKCHAGDIPSGQRIMYQRKTFFGIDAVVCVHGDAESMTVEHFGWFVLGEWRGWKSGTLEDLRHEVKKWVAVSQAKHPATSLLGILLAVVRKYTLGQILTQIGASIIPSVSTTKRDR